MNPARIYLETTMFSFYYETRELPEYQKHKATIRRVFDRIKAGDFEPFTSDYAVDEIQRTKNQEKRGNMLSLIGEYDITLLPRSAEAALLADLYIAEGVVPKTEPTDAAHIAITAANGLDFIVSLNFEHIVRPWAIERVRQVNLREGYNPIGIYKPVEVLEL
jgi:hypothetical protein